MECPSCKKDFEQRRSNQKYCSRRCKEAEHWKRRFKRERKPRRNGWNTKFIYKEVVYSFFNSQCTKCSSKENLELHHIIPIFLGGTNDFKNVTLLCRKCHKELHRTF